MVIDDALEGYATGYELRGDVDTATGGWPTIRGDARAQGRVP